MEERNSGQVFRFGIFEANLRTHELFKEGRRVRVQEQPFQVLAMLLERQQEMVSRDELHRGVWPSDTFVDFENSLNVAVNRLREALGDSATSPRFIETLPRRGYRFIAPAHVVDINTVSVPSSNGTPLTSASSPKVGWLLGLLIALLLSVTFTAAFLRTAKPLRVTRMVQLTNTKLVIPNNGGSLDSPLLADESRLYFSQMEKGRLFVLQLPITGGDAVPLSTPFQNTVLFDLSRDGSEFLVGSLTDGGGDVMPLWILPTSGGPPRRVGNAQAEGAGWSPDGTQIAYSTQKDLFTVTRDGSNERKLTNVTCECSVLFPRWSPDGRTLRFTVENYANQTSTLREVPIDGGKSHPVFEDWRGHHNRKGNWTSDGKTFVFDDYHNAWAQSGATDLFHWSLPAPVQLTEGPLTMYSVASNRNGSKFFAVGERSQGEVQRYVGESKSFQRFLDGISAEGFDFSRDGEWMVYVSFPEGTLWRSHADGRGRVQLTSPPLVADHPRWSPDGSRITFTGQLAGKPLNVYVVNADGSNLQPVPGSEWRISPSWSADGNSLAFVTDAKHRDLVLYNLKTRATTTLTRGEVFFPVWSPDGNHIAAAVPRPPRLGILDLKTGRWRYLDVGSSVPNSWAWSRDARYLYLDFALTKNPSVQRIRIPDGHREKIADLTNVTRSNGNFDIWFGLDAQNSPMILRDLSSQQIYALEMQP